jgi:hypothetical protein
MQLIEMSISLPSFMQFQICKRLTQCKAYFNDPDLCRSGRESLKTV